MSAFSRFRAYHWLLATLFGLAYLTGESAGLLHVWLGYGLMAVLGFRLIVAGLRARGFPALWPTRKSLRDPLRTLTGKVLTSSLVLLCGAILASGVVMIDNRAAWSEGLSSILPAAMADSGENSPAEAQADNTPWLDTEEMHQWLADAMLVFTGLHISWILLFRRRFAWSMLGVSPGALPAKPEKGRAPANRKHP